MSNAISLCAQFPNDPVVAEQSACIYIGVSAIQPLTGA